MIRSWRSSWRIVGSACTRKVPSARSTSSRRIFRHGPQGAISGSTGIESGLWSAESGSGSGSCRTAAIEGSKTTAPPRRARRSCAGPRLRNTRQRPRIQEVRPFHTPHDPLELEEGPFSTGCYGVHTIQRDSRGSLWFGTSTFGVCRYDGKSFTWITEDELTELDDGRSFGVRGIIEDKDGKFWFSNLLHRYDAYPDGATANATTASWYTKERGLVEIGEKGGSGNAYFMSRDAPDGSAAHAVHQHRRGSGRDARVTVGKIGRASCRERVWRYV